MWIDIDKKGGETLHKIIVNKIKCKKCGEEIESTYTHDFVTCKCGACSVDGGHSYLRRCGDLNDWIELSICEDQERDSY